MRTLSIASVLTVICLVLSLVFEDKPAMSVSAGAPEAKTGSPSDGATCFSQCHGAGPGTPNGNETMGLIGLPAGGYVPGQTYNLNLALSGSSNDVFGFQISPQDWTGHMQGTWITGGSNQVQITNTKWLTQTFAGNTGSAGAVDWDFQWEAPGLGTGDVHFYFTSIFADGMNAHLGDVMLQDSVVISENTNVGVNESQNEPGILFRALGNQLRISNPLLKKLKVSVITLDGKEVYQRAFSNSEYNIDLRGQSTAGVRVVVLKGENILKIERFILHN